MVNPQFFRSDRRVKAPVERAGQTTDRRTAMPHQRVVLDWAKSRDAVGIFMQMRMGKSLVATRWAQSKQPSRVLILAPTPAIPDWLNELKLEGVDPILLQGSTRERVSRARETDGWFITNPEGSWIRLDEERWVSPLLTMKWDVLILDESTVMKNPTARITQVLLKKTFNTRCKCILSGYPAPETPMNYFTQMVFLSGGYFLGCKNWWGFRQKYFINPFMHEWYPKKGALADIKDGIQEFAFVMTRKQARIGSRKIYKRRIVKMNAAQKKMIKQIDDEFMVELASGKELLSKFVIVNFSWLARVAGGFDPEGNVLNTAKAKEVLSLLKGDLTSEQIIIWFRFNDELKWMYEFLHEQHRFTCAKIMGPTTLEERKEIQDEFRRGRIQVLLVQIRCNRGVDYSAADTAIYYSNGFSGEDRVQSEDRIVHPKKDRPLLYIDIHTEASIDEYVAESLRDKSITAKVMMMKLMKRRYDSDIN